MSSRFPLPCPIVPQALCTSTFVPVNHLPLGTSVHCPLFFVFKVPLLLCHSACLSLSISVPRPLCLLASWSFVLYFVSLCSLLPFCPSAPLFIIVTQPCGPLAYLSFSVYLSPSPFLKHSVSWPLSPSASQSLSPSGPQPLAYVLNVHSVPLTLCRSASLSFSLHITWLLCHSASLSLVLSVVRPLCPSASVILCPPLSLGPSVPQPLSPSAPQPLAYVSHGHSVPFSL